MDGVCRINFNQRRICFASNGLGPRPQPALHRPDSPSSRDFAFALTGYPIEDKGLVQNPRPAASAVSPLTVDAVWLRPWPDLYGPPTVLRVLLHL